MTWFKMLYISSDHSTLETEHLTLFNELDIDFFSTGAYKNPQNPNLEHAQRHPLNLEPKLDLIKEFDKLNPNRKLHTRVNLSKELVDNFDVVFVSHCCPYPYFVKDNWDIIKHKPVSWLTYTQQNSQVELMTQKYRKQGLKIIRLSPKERTIPNYAGDDAIIRSYMEPDVYKDWNGKSGDVLTFNNFTPLRYHVSNIPTYLSIKAKFPGKFHLYGSANEGCKFAEGYLTWEEQKQKYRDASIYFALGSKPASLTYNFMEALLTGTPVITWGRQLGNLTTSPDFKDTYEIPDLFENGVHCFYSDSEDELIEYVHLLLENRSVAETISANGRKKAIELWDKNTVKQQWIDFFNNFMLK